MEMTIEHTIENDGGQYYAYCPSMVAISDVLSIKVAGVPKVFLCELCGENIEVTK